MLPFLDAIQPDLERVNATIIKRLYSEEPLVEDIGKHLINAGGKRLRPILVLMTANALDHSGNEHIDIAAIIEFIHTATLLHDDVVDVSSLRRGLPTANATWGNAPSVLVGDFLYSRAFQMLVSIGNMDIMRVMADTTNVIAEGEVQQLANSRNPELSEEEYVSVIYKKTAALFEAASKCGALISSTDIQQQAALSRYGYHLGLAFQLMDDLLDYDGDTETLGKNVGDDLAEGKATLPVIRSLQSCNEAEREIIYKAIREADTSQLDTIVALVKRYDGILYTRQKATGHAEKAVRELDALPDSSWKDALTELAQFSVKRAY
jgi:octaprenyl-diphosphate synthase